MFVNEVTLRTTTLSDRNAKNTKKTDCTNNFLFSFFYDDGAVRSFGTEERETSYPIMPQPTVYDYILFRGSDIKDIRVVNNVAIPNDPAIMQMHLPSNQMQPPQNFPPQNFAPMQPGGAPMGQFGPFGQMQGNMGPPMGPGMTPQSQQQQAQSPIQAQQQGNLINHLAPGSGSGQKNKKSSELSKSNEGEKSAEKSPKTIQPTEIRKQNNRSQGVHRSVSFSFFLSLDKTEYCFIACFCRCLLCA